jgi:hypothetical protein
LIRELLRLDGPEQPLGVRPQHLVDRIYDESIWLRSPDFANVANVFVGFKAALVLSWVDAALLIAFTATRHTFENSCSIKGAFSIGRLLGWHRFRV